jgi:hypothetical protein
MKLATSGISVVNLPANFGTFYSEHAAQELNGWGLRVITSREVASVLGLERQKQLLGCSEESSECMAELANALGVDGLLLGDIAKFGNVYQVNLKVIAAATGKVLAAYSERVDREEVLLDTFSRGAEKIARDLAAATGRPAPTRTAAPVMVMRSQAPTMSSTPLRRYSWIPAVAAVGGAVAGGFFWSSSRGALNELSTSPQLDFARAESLRDSGSRAQTTAVVAFALSGAALTMFFWTGDAADPTVAAAATPNGVAVGGTF